MAIQFVDGKITNIKEQPITMIYDVVPKKIATISIDAFIEEKHSSKNTVSDLPVEEGYNISDNVFEEPDEIEISGFISSAWNTSESYRPIDDLRKNAVPLHNSLRDKVIQFNQALKKLVKDRKPITITTGLDVYEDMVITSYDVPRDVETGSDLHFSMTLRKIRIVSSEMDVMVNAPDSVANGQLSIEVEGGNGNVIIADFDPKLDDYLKRTTPFEVRGEATPEDWKYWTADMEIRGEAFAKVKGVQWQQIKNYYKKAYEAGAGARW